MEHNPNLYIHSARRWKEAQSLRIQQPSPCTRSQYTTTSTPFLLRHCMAWEEITYISRRAVRKLRKCRVSMRIYAVGRILFAIHEKKRSNGTGSRSS
jgi:hypothetical protein